MPISIKTREEIEKMRRAGRLAAEVLEMIEAHVRPGITTTELDRICHAYITGEQQAIPAPLNYRGFPKSICTSVNHVVCHGIPDERRLLNGDILNIDVTVIKDGYHGDTSRMYMVGRPSARARRLAEISYECMRRGIAQVAPGRDLCEIGRAIEQYAHAQRCSVVEEYCGHGIGREFHEDPQVLHYWNGAPGVRLAEGMTFTIEPMINAGKRHVRLLQDGWTVVTRDRSLSAQWEHTVLVTATGCEVLTRRKEEAPGLDALPGGA